MTYKFKRNLFFIFVFCFASPFGKAIEQEKNQDFHKTVLFPVVVRPILTMGIDTPLDYLNTHKQLRQKSYKSIFTEGLKTGTFFQGYKPKFCNALLKNSYSWPIITKSPHLFDILFPELKEKNITILKKAFAALNYAVVDALISTPFEFVKVQQMTKKNPLKPFFKNISLYYKGSFCSFQNTFLGCFSYLVIENKIRSFVTSFTPRKELGAKEFLTIGAILSLTQSTITSPFLTVRTRLQAGDSKAMSFRELYQQGIFKNLYAGWRMRVLRGVLTGAFDSFIFNALMPLSKNE
jgi:hypothetical protein